MENQDTTDSTVEEAEASGAGTGLCVSESDYEGKCTCSNLVDRQKTSPPRRWILVSILVECSLTNYGCLSEQLGQISMKQPKTHTQ